MIGRVGVRWRERGCDLCVCVCVGRERERERERKREVGGGDVSHTPYDQSK